MQPADRLVEIGASDQKAFRAAGEQDVAAGLVDRRARRLHARYRKIEVVERLGLVAGRILDREPRDPGLDAQPHALRHALGLVRIAALEIGVHRQVGRGDDLGDMRKHVVARHRRVGETARECKTRAGRGERLEAQMLQVARGADVPWIGNDEASGRMQLAKRGALFGDGGHETLSDCKGDMSISIRTDRTRLSRTVRRVGWTGCRAHSSRKS